MTMSTRQYWGQGRKIKAILSIAVFLLFSIAHACNSALAGGMIVSDTSPNLAVNAYGGAANGTVLKLVDNCTPDNSDCTWTYRNGMLVSDTNPQLAVNAYGGAANGTVLKLVDNCTPDNTDCTWTLRKGMLLSDTNSGLAVNAYGGATNGTELKLVNNCPPDNTDCTWTLRKGMVLGDTNSGLAMNAYGGAAQGTVLNLVTNCPPNNTDCTWTLHKGMLLSDTNPSLAMNAYGGAAQGTVLKLVTNCPPDNTDCTWTLHKGMLLSDTNSGLAMNAYGGAAQGTVLKLVTNCPPNNTDCTWTYGGIPAGKSGWGGRLASAFAPENRRGPNAIHLFSPANPNIGSPGGRLESDGGSATGNYHLAIPLLSLPGRGLNLSLTAQYNSQIWSSTGGEAGEAQFAYDLDGDWPVPGLNLGFGKLVFPGNALFIDPNGTRRELSDVQYESVGGHFTGRATATVMDGSGVTVECPGGSGGCNKSPFIAYAHLDNGGNMEMLSVSLGKVVDNRSYYPTKISDASGNFIQIDYRKDATGQPSPPNIDHITDTVGRIVQFHYDAQGLPIAITGPGQNGSVRTYARFYYHHHNQTVVVPNIPPKGNTGGGRQTVRLDMPVLDAIVFPGNQTGYVFTDYTPYGIPKTVNVNRNMTISTESLTDQGTFGEGQTTRGAAFDYPDSADLTTLRKLAPHYTQRVDTWTDPITGADQRATTSYSTADGATTVTAPDGSVVVQATVTDPNGLVDWTRTIGSDGKWLTTTQYFWEAGADGIPRQTEVRVLNHEINATARTEFRYGMNNLQVVEEIQHDYAALDKVDQAPVKLRKVRQYVNDPAYRATAFNLVSVESLFNGKTTGNPAYSLWQQRLPQFQAAVDKARANLAASQQAVDVAQQAVNALGKKPEATIPNDNPPPPKVANPDYAKWVKEMAPLQAALDQAQAAAFQAQQALAAAQSDYAAFSASPPSQTLPVETARTSYEYDAPNLIALNPKPIAYSPFIDFPLPRGKVTKVTRWLAPDAQSITDGALKLRGIETSYVYDVAGNLRETHSGPSSGTTVSYTAETQYSLPASVSVGATDPASSQRVTTTAAYDVGIGLLTASTDADGATTQTAYTPGASGWRIASVRAPAGAITSYTYRDGDMSVDTTLKDGEGRSHVQTTRYDGRGLPRDVQAQRHTDGGRDIEEVRYDAMGRTVQAMAAKRTTDPGPERWTTFTYDPAGRLSATKDPAGNVSSLYCNEAARPAAAQGLLGSTVRTVDPWNREHWNLSDAFGETRLDVLPDPATGKVADQGSQAISYDYDEQGRTVRVGHDPQARTFRYDSVGRVAGVAVPERNATLDIRGVYHEAGGTFSDVYAYDDKSYLIAHIDPRGARTNYRYNDDPLSRLQQVDYDLTAVGDRSSPVAPAAITSFRYVPAGHGDQRRVATVLAQDAVQIDGSYDGFGRPIAATWTFPTRLNGSLGISTHYDSLGRVTSFAYPARYEPSQVKSGPRLDYAYSADGGLMEADLDGSPLVKAIDHGVLGVRSMTLVNNGVTLLESNQFDPLSSRLTKQTVTGPAGQLLSDLGYAYKDAAHSAETGQMLVQTDALDVQRRRRHEYDAWGRLTSSYLGSEPPTGDTTRQDYQYDAHGNRTASTGSRFDQGTNSWVRWDGLADGTSPGVEPSTNRITQSGFLYDKAGNLIQRPDEIHGGVQRYVYDAAERLVRVEDGAGKLIEAYLYGPDRRRVGASADLTNWNLTVWDGDAELARYGAGPISFAPNWRDMSIYVGRRLLAELSHEAGSMTMFHPDQRGIALETTPSGGAVTATRKSVRPYGAGPPLAAADPAPERQFTSYRRSALTGLDYAINRYYDPRLGRFIQPDPVGQGGNLYAYAGGDPVNRIDPVGLAEEEVPQCVGGYITIEGKKYMCDQVSITGAAPDPTFDLSGPQGGLGNLSVEGGAGGAADSLVQKYSNFVSKTKMCRNNYLNKYYNWGPVPGASAIRYASPISFAYDLHDSIHSWLEAALVKGTIAAALPAALNGLGYYLEENANPNPLSASADPGTAWEIQDLSLSGSEVAYGLAESFPGLVHKLGEAGLLLGEFAFIQDWAATAQCEVKLLSQ